MKAEHLEILVEEPSMEAFLRELLPRILGPNASFNIYPYQCKDDLLDKLPSRLNGYKNWLPKSWRIVVIVDRDDDDCVSLKKKLEKIAQNAGFRTRTNCVKSNWQVLNRIAVEELEAWYFGDWDAVCQVYPKVNVNIPNKESYRKSDAILGGTWEAFERVLQKSGYFKNGLRKTEAARAIGKQADPVRSRSPSFQVFRDAILEVV
jgi:hypothetical protein